MHSTASANGTAQWLGRLEKDSHGTRKFIKAKSVMPDNSLPRSSAWNVVFSALGEKSDADCLNLIETCIAEDKFEVLFGLDTGDSGWSLLHKAIAFDRALCTRYLLAEGAPSTLEDRKGNSPMKVAVWFNSRRCIAIIDSESKRIHGARKKSKLKTSALMAFEYSGERQKMKRRSKEHAERLESKAKELNLSLTPIKIAPSSKPTKSSASSLSSFKSSVSVNSAARLLEGLARIDGSLVGEVEMENSDNWTTQSHDITTLDSSHSMASSSSSLDNWYSQLPSNRKSNRDSLWGVVDPSKHQYVRVGHRHMWVSKENHVNDTSNKILRFVEELNTAKSPESRRRSAPAPIVSPLSDR
jgi:hypothetical protein